MNGIAIFLFVSFINSVMSSLATEPSSPETMTSRASIISTNEVTDDQITTLSSTLTPEKHVATQSLTGRNHVTRIYANSPHYLPLACLALIFNPPLGIPAFVCAVLSRKFRLSGHEHKSARCSEGALWLSLVAIASAIVIIIFTIVYVLVITPNIIRTIEGIKDTDGEVDTLPNSEEGFVYHENITIPSVFPP